MICETTNFVYPLLADIYYPIVETGAYGNLKKQWVLDRTIACSVNVTGTKNKEDIIPNVNIVLDTMLIGRTKTNVLKSTNGQDFSMTNIIITNIRGNDGVSIYNESSGTRSGQSTIYEFATISPIVGPFGKTEYYKLILRRSENQAADL